MCNTTGTTKAVECTCVPRPPDCPPSLRPPVWSQPLAVPGSSEQIAKDENLLPTIGIRYLDVPYISKVQSPYGGLFTAWLLIPIGVNAQASKATCACIPCLSSCSVEMQANESRGSLRAGSIIVSDGGVDEMRIKRPSAAQGASIF